VVLLVAACADAAGAAPPEGPRLAFVAFGAKPQRLELLSIDPSAKGPQLFAGGSIRARPLPLPGPLSWSPDGGTLAFAGLARRTRHGRAVQQLYLAGADGSGGRAIPKTEGGFDPVFAPDGHTIAFARSRTRKRPDHHGGETVVYRSTTIWLTDVNGGTPRRLTAWRNGLEYEPTSFSPGGSELAASRQRGPYSQPEVVAIHMDGSGAAVLARGAVDAVYSPDGSRLAYLLAFEHRTISHAPPGGKGLVKVEETTDLYTMNADGTSPSRVTDTPKGIELWPSWDPSGRRLAVVQLRGGSEAASLGLGDAIVQMNADGSCATTVLSRPGIGLFGVAWQPGAARGAGPIAC
jgi:Tol biopolymer transport system component